tara:strand:- start:1525 stop:2601 length:1077 start_codon:yes stop_codon:yes gene_type:complete
MRYGLGNNYPQLASFQCYECSKQIETGYDVFKGDRILNGAKSIDDESLWEDNLKVVNLHPEIPTTKGNENNPVHFQTMDVFKNLHKSKADIGKFKAEQVIWSKFNGKWKKVEKPLRIISNKDEEKLKSVCNLNFNQFTKLYNEWFLIFVRGEQETDFYNLCDDYNSIDLTQIKVFAKTQDKFIKQINELCNTYMQFSQQFQSTMFHQKYGWEITDELVANINWNDIGTVYGDLYEIIGDFFVIPTMINNLIEGRDFDEFKSQGFTLSKYLKTDKANRAKNFETNENLAFLANAYHSWLRNGTHHKNSFMNAETFEVSLGTSKGGTIEKKISVIEYIKNCNELFGVGLMISSIILELKK